jgi:hypothetical protein
MPLGLAERTEAVAFNHAKVAAVNMDGMKKQTVVVAAMAELAGRSWLAASLGQKPRIYTFPYTYTK